MHILSLVFLLSLVQQSLIITWKMEQFQKNKVRMPLICVCVHKGEKDILTVPHVSIPLFTNKNGNRKVSFKLKFYKVIKYYLYIWKNKKNNIWVPCFWDRFRSHSRKILLQEVHPSHNKREGHTCVHRSLPSVCTFLPSSILWAFLTGNHQNLNLVSSLKNIVTFRCYTHFNLYFS